MKPFLEKLVPHGDASWSRLNRRLDEAIPFQWHHHPEYELTLTLNSQGQRFIGDHTGSYDDGDLVLVGSNLPHTWSSVARIDEGQPHVALVLWLRPEWVAGLPNSFPELAPVTRMFERGAGGLAFSSGISGQARPLIEALFADEPARGLPRLLELLMLLAGDKHAAPLANPAFVPRTRAGERDRIDRILDHLHAHYRRAVGIEEIASIAALSASGVHRLFRRHLQMTVSDYLSRLRISSACALLSSSDLPIAHVADEVGFETLANFNRQFKAIRGQTPRDYRRRFRP